MTKFIIIIIFLLGFAKFSYGLEINSDTTKKTIYFKAAWISTNGLYYMKDKNDDIFLSARENYESDFLIGLRKNIALGNNKFSLIKVLNIVYARNKVNISSISKKTKDRIQVTQLIGLPQLGIKRNYNSFRPALSLIGSFALYSKVKNAGELARQSGILNKNDNLKGRFTILANAEVYVPFSNKWGLNLSQTIPFWGPIRTAHFNAGYGNFYTAVSLEFQIYSNQ